MCFAFLLTIQYCIVWRENNVVWPHSAWGGEFAHTHYSPALVSPQTALHHPGCTENPADVTVWHQRPKLGSIGETWIAWTAWSSGV